MTKKISPAYLLAVAAFVYWYMNRKPNYIGTVGPGGTIGGSVTT